MWLSALRRFGRGLGAWAVVRTVCLEEGVYVCLEIYIETMDGSTV